MCPILGIAVRLWLLLQLVVLADSLVSCSQFGLNDGPSSLAHAGGPVGPGPGPGPGSGKLHQ